MNLDKYSQKSQEVILAVQSLAQDFQHQVVEPFHLAMKILSGEIKEGTRSLSIMAIKGWFSYKGVSFNESTKENCSWPILISAWKSPPPARESSPGVFISSFA